LILRNLTTVFSSFSPWKCSSSFYFLPLASCKYLHFVQNNFCVNVCKNICSAGLKWRSGPGESSWNVCSCSSLCIHCKARLASPHFTVIVFSVASTRVWTRAGMPICLRFPAPSRAYQSAASKTWTTFAGQTALDDFLIVCSIDKISPMHQLRLICGMMMMYWLR